MVTFWFCTPSPSPIICADDARIAAALEFLKKKGIATAVKLGQKGRVTSQGVIVTIADNKPTNTRAIVEVCCL